MENIKVFLIQTDEEGIPVNDMGFATIEAVKFHRWKMHWITDREYDYVLFNSLNFTENSMGINFLKKDVIPVGNIEFVEKFLYDYRKIVPKAINIPQELLLPEYLKREVNIVHLPSINEPMQLGEKKFVKSLKKIKGVAGITDSIGREFLCEERVEIGEDGRSLSKDFIVSDIIDIVAEWRCFVFRDRLLDTRQYLGEIGVYPDVSKIKNMISSYKNGSPAYTLDVAVNNKGETVILECHNFWSCGLYGFSDYNNLLPMISQAFQWEMKNK